MKQNPSAHMYAIDLKTLQNYYSDVHISPEGQVTICSLNKFVLPEANINFAFIGLKSINRL